MKNNLLILVGIVIFAVLLIGMLFGLGYSLEGAAKEIALPILAIAGVVLLFATLALVSVSFAVFDLDDKKQALALPEGSVRAAIALSLIVLFAILTVFLYSNLSSAGVHTITGLSLDQRKNFVSSFKDQVVLVTPEGDVGPFTIYYRDGQNPASNDFAKQLLVLVGTLVTSVSSFYFGTRAAGSGAAAGDVPRAGPEIRGINPTTQPRGGVGPFDMDIAGDRLDLIKEVKIVSASNQIVATDVVSNASSIKCRLQLGPNVPAGAWDVIVTDGVGRTARLPNALTVTAPP